MQWCIYKKGSISHDAYINLAALQPELPRVHNILNARKRIEPKNFHFHFKHQESSSYKINETPDIEDQEIVDEVLKYIGKAGYRRIADILL